MKEPVKKGFLVVFIGFLLITAAFLYQRASVQSLHSGSVPLRVAPAFELKGPTGVLSRLRDAAGHRVIVHFWASWCPPCLEELPGIMTFATKAQALGVRLFIVTLDERWPDALALLERAKPPASVISVMDEGMKTANEYGSFEFPETYLLNSRHEIVTKWVGPQKWDDPFFLEILNQVD